MSLKGKIVVVAKFVRRSQRIAQSMKEFTNCYIKRLKDEITEDQVKEYMGKYGEIVSVCVSKSEKETPFAFCNFAQHADAQKAVDECHDKNIPELCNGEDKLYCQRAQKKTERQAELKKRFAQLKAKRFNEYQGHNLYVKNLDESVDETLLRETFAKFGDITSCKIMTDDKTNTSKGFGFLCFKELESANKAIAEMNGVILVGKPLYVNVAQRKEVRRATLEMQYAARVGRGPAGGLPQPSQPMPFPSYSPAPYPYGYQAPGYYQMAPRGLPGGPRWNQPALPAGFNTMGRAATPAGRGRATGMPRTVSGGAPQMPNAARGRGPVPGTKMALPPQQGMQYSKQARNQTMPPGPGGELTAEQLASMTPEQQKNALGEKLFTRISTSQPDHAAKITGMLLEMDLSEQINLLESPEQLQGKIQEAMDVLQNHEATS
eukprot:NODE_105_length_2292_cov_81.818014_g83_i0.p1 GENE.NODE_105_length_2292_cov_81.818014_g83_i0~~NODE_105_length_2292_cov_81.818014_g83_i0.p1  ORF type:complete len:497 (-),score=156.79 NODE_105_length_2292_cov_81.818014_g83_i0:800-2098(-)